MAGNPADERFRPPDPSIGGGNPTVQLSIQAVAHEASSSSLQRMEEAVNVATIEAEIDASRHYLATGYNPKDMGSFDVQVLEAKSHAMEIAKSHAMEAARATLNTT